MRRYFFGVVLIILLLVQCKPDPANTYVCPPCDKSCDLLYFSEAGLCPHCKMKLIPKIKSSWPDIGEISIKEGKGYFLISTNSKKEKRLLKVSYYKPSQFNKKSKILIVIPGAGRNADSYRDAWIEHSEKFSVLVLSVMYSEFDYKFDDYHLCGLIENSNSNEVFQKTTNSNLATLDEENYEFDVIKDQKNWIFDDFDRIFQSVIENIETDQSLYDLFGHSAGGQILHRMALFSSKSMANRIIAANSGFYTLPDPKENFPFGINNFEFDDQYLKTSFQKRLFVMVGELDNQDEKRGTLLRSVSADAQGHHRLERGKYFYNFSKEKAESLDMDFNWKFYSIPNVGHNHKKMANSAARILYES